MIKISSLQDYKWWPEVELVWHKAAAMGNRQEMDSSLQQETAPRDELANQRATVSNLLSVNRKTINGSCNTADAASQILVLKIKFMLDVDKIPPKVRLTSVFCELVSKKKKKKKTTYYLQLCQSCRSFSLSTLWFIQRRMNMCIHVYVCMHVFICAYAYVRIFMYMDIQIYVMFVLLYMRIWTFRYIHFSIYVHTILCMCVSVHKYSFLPYIFSVCLGLFISVYRQNTSECLYQILQFLNSYHFPFFGGFYSEKSKCLPLLAFMWKFLAPYVT